jgi:TP901 family phage tail tape measure protein
LAENVKGIVVEIGGDTKGLSKAIRSLNSEIRGTQSELNKVNRLLKLDPTNIDLLKQKEQLLGEQIKNTENKVESLRNAKKKADQEMADGTEINQKQYRELVRELTSAELKLKDLQAEASRSRAALAQVSAVTGEIAEKSGNIAKKFAPASLAFAGAGVAATKAAVEFESAFAGVEKTVDGTTEQLAALRQGILDMAEEIPASTTEIAAVAEAAGQLGIATDDVLDFTRVMIDLGEATNLSADEAASALAKFANITGTTADEYSKLGSTIVDLGNNFATTERDIVEMATRLASAGTVAGLSEQDILALSTAMSSVGIEAEAGGTAMTQTLTAISKAVSAGGDDLETFAKIAGVSASKFADMWGNEPIDAISAFIGGLGKMNENGEDTISVLDKLGLSGIRQSNMLRALALASDVLDDAVTTANNAWKENVALSNETSKRYKTKKSQIEILRNGINNLAISIGDILLPIINKIVAGLQNAIDWFSNLDDGVKKTILIVGGLIAAISPVAGIISGIAGAMSKLTGTVIPAIIEAATKMGPIITTVVEGISSGIGAAIGFITETAIPAVMSAVSSAFTFITGTVIPGIVTGITTAVNFLIANPIVLIISAIVGLVALIATKGDEIQAILQRVDDFLQGVFTTDWSESFGVLGEILNFFFSTVKSIWDSIKAVFDGIIDFVRGVFTGDWERAWKGVQEIFNGIFTALVAIAKAPLNGIIALINMVIDAINWMINGLNKIHFDVPDWVPVLGGKSLGFNIPTIGKIAYLAKGGVLSSGSAIVGEAGPELLTMAGGRAHVMPLNGNERGGITIEMNNTFNGYDNAAGEAAARNLVQAVNRALGRAY